MAKAKIRLLKQVKINVNGKLAWTKCPVVVGKDGRHKLSRVMVDGVEQEHPDGVYHLDYRVGSVRKRVTVQSVLEATGRHGLTPANIGATEIRLAINNIERHLEGFKAGDADDVKWSIEQAKGLLVLKPVEGQPTIAESIAGYLRGLWASDPAASSVEVYTGSLSDFEEFCRGVAPNQEIPRGYKTVRYPADITATLLQDYYAYMRVGPPNRKRPAKKCLSATTRNGKLGHIGTWLKAVKIPGVADLMAGIERAPNDDPDTSPFSDEALKKLFNTCTERGLIDHADLFLFALGTGMRASEIAVAEFADLISVKDGEGGFIDVRQKPEIGYKPKTLSSVRKVPISGALLGMLDQRKGRMPGGTLIFPTGGLERPTNKYLRMLKEVGDLAGIACGVCMGCRTEGFECEQIYMHKFRHTYACHLLWNWIDDHGTMHKGTDIKTVSRWLGHSTTSTTQKYLDAMPELEGLAVVNTSRLNTWITRSPVTMVAMGSAAPTQTLPTPELWAEFLQFKQFMASKNGVA